MKHKLIFFYLLSFLFLKLSPTNVVATDSQYKKIVLIINQVRGVECCDKGSTEKLSQQLKSLTDNNLKGNFAIRYDALADSSFVSLLKNLDASQFEIGAFLEITPQLASDAGVKYVGDLDEWYKAENAYTVGYEFEDRKKIIDTYMGEFFTTFGVYPKFSTAWIMDTDSVNYINKEYGVLTHQITREQWGTDSYTMSGGFVHYPYFASKNWLFAKSRDGQLEDNKEKQTLVLRQTGADPLLNYGDDTNSHTTQPNDYAIGKRGFEYFRKLRNQFINQQHNNYGFLLLGLENSMDGSFQDEFSRQMDSIKEDDEVVSMTTSELRDFAGSNNQKVLGLAGSNFVANNGSRSFWVNGENYRARFLYKNNNLYLSDLRLINDQLEDPYNQYVAKDLAFWVTPFIFNASQQYSLEGSSSLSGASLKDKFLNNLREKYLPEFQKTNLEIKSSHNDSSSYFDGIKISENIREMSGFSRSSENNLVLSYLDQSNNKKEVVFYEDHMETSFEIAVEDLILEQSNFLSVVENKDGFEVIFGDDGNSGEFLSLSARCDKGSCRLLLSQPSNTFFNQLRDDYYPYFFPEIKDRVINNLKSVFYAHNKYAVIGKNPVRFVFIPKDEKGFATNYKSEPEIVVIPNPKDIELHKKQANGTTFLDITSDVVGKYEIKFLVDGLIDKEEVMFFAPDCKNNLAYCMLHPVESIWYISSMFYTKLRNF